MPISLRIIDKPSCRNTAIPPIDGKGEVQPDRHFVHSCETFSKFWKEGVNKPTPKTSVEVHGFNEECSAQELFQFFSGSLESVAFYPQQVPAYIAAHKDCLVYESMPNLFLLKHETSAGAIEFRLADVRVVANGSALFNRIYTDPADASKLIERIKLGRLFTASAIAA